MKHEILNAIRAYRAGQLSPAAFVSIVFQHIDESTLSVLLPLCPRELMKVLIDVVKASPTTDADWAKLKFVQNTVGRGLTPEESEKAVAILRARYRKGVETLRKHLESR